MNKLDDGVPYLPILDRDIRIGGEQQAESRSYKL